MSNVLPDVSLTPEQEKTWFYRRWDEFRNTVEMSYSIPEDDANVTVYDVSGAKSGDGPPGLWCPLQCAGVPFESWQDYPQRKREAIRLGFMHGLCEMISMRPPATLANWQYFRPEISKPGIYDRHFNPITERAHRTGNYATGRKEIEELLTTIYGAGQHIPYHPNFEHTFFAHLGQVHLSGLTDFLAGFSKRNGLANCDGYAYLLDLVEDAVETAGLNRPTAIGRARSWLRQALDTSAAPAATELLDTPTEGTSAAATPLIRDEFLPHFRQAVRLINKNGFTEADCERLTQLGQHLVKELDDSIKKRPKATKLRLIEALRECLDEMRYAESMLSCKLAELKINTPALYDARYPLIREAIAAAEDTLGGLIELLGKYYPETLTGNIRTTEGQLAMRELVLRYLPGFHDLNKRIRYEQDAPDTPAAPATTEPPQPGSLALDTPAPSPWEPLLTGLLELPALFEFFADCGLLTPTGELTALGKGTDGQKGGKAPWAGTLQALMKSRHLDNNVAAICRVLLDPAGRIQVRLNEGTLRDYSGKAGTYLDVANGYLKKRGILRN